MMYRQVDRQNYAYSYVHTFFIQCTEFLACMHTKFATVAHTTQKLKQIAVGILLIYCTVVGKYCQGTQESV